MEKLMTLFNKDHPVLKAIYDDEFHRFTKITEFTDLRYAPPAIINNRKTPERSALNDWWASRAVPASRQHLNQDFPYLNDVLSLPEKNMGLSLSDRYWVSDDPENDKWEDINFFDHPFSEDLGLVTLGQKQQSPELNEDLFSPNGSLNGDLRKKWTLQNQKPVLLKSGSGPFNQEPYNEAAASALHERLLAPEDFVPYQMQGRYCACPNMLHEDEELVPMWDIFKNHKKPNSMNDYQFCIRLCEECGLLRDQIITHFEKMFTCDFILANHDRHYRNFGLIRNVETLQYTRMAPIYDTGACLYHDQFTLDKRSDYEYTAKPFGRNGMAPENQLKLFHNFDWFDENKLSGFIKEAIAILSENPLMPDDRIRQIQRGLERNIACAVDYIKSVRLGQGFCSAK